MNLFTLPNRKEILFCFLFGVSIYIIFLVTDGNTLKDPESITFGFGPIIKSLINNNEYKASSILYPGGIIHDSYAHRMPLIPIWFSVFGKYLKLATFVRAVFFAFISIPATRMLIKLSNKKIAQFSLLIILFSPLLLRRIVDITNEESWLSIFIPCSFVGMCYLKEKFDLKKIEFISISFYIILLLALSYLAKSSTLYLGTAILIIIIIKGSNKKLLNYGNILLISSPIIASIICWNIHVFSSTGHLTLGTSWDGWNILKGNNPYFNEYFPSKSLDILDYRGLIKVSNIDINTEWLIDKDLKNQAISWISSNPVQFLKNTIYKIYIIFIDPRILPIMPWHNNYSIAIKLTSLSLFFTKFASWALLIPNLSNRFQLLNSNRLFKLLNSGKHLDLYLIYLSLYFAPFIIGKYDVRHYAPIIPIIIILGAIRIADNNKV